MNCRSVWAVKEEAAKENLKRSHVFPDFTNEHRNRAAERGPVFVWSRVEPDRRLAPRGSCLSGRSCGSGAKNGRERPRLRAPPAIPKCAECGGASLDGSFRRLRVAKAARGNPRRLSPFWGSRLDVSELDVSVLDAPIYQVRVRRRLAASCAIERFGMRVTERRGQASVEGRALRK